MAASAPPNMTIVPVKSGKRGRQPQGRAAIDWSNPLTKGLVSASIPHLGELVRKLPPLLSQNTVRMVSQDGVGLGYVADRDYPINEAPMANYTAYSELLCVNNKYQEYYGALLRAYPGARGWSWSYDNYNMGWRIPGPDWNTSTEIYRNTTPTSLMGRHILCGIWNQGKNGGIGRMFYDGAELPGGSGDPQTTISSTTTSSRAVAVGAGNFNNSILLRLEWNRDLRPEEAAAMTRNPWQIFKGVEKRIRVPAPSKFMRIKGPKRASQPQTAPQIDWSNPITRGMFHCFWVGAGKKGDLLNYNNAMWYLANYGGLFLDTATRRGVGMNHPTGSAEGLLSGRTPYAGNAPKLPFTAHVAGNFPAQSGSFGNIAGFSSAGGYAGLTIGHDYGQLAVRLRSTDGNAYMAQDSVYFSGITKGVSAICTPSTLALYKDGVKCGTGGFAGSVYFDDTYARHRIFGGDSNDGVPGAIGTVYYAAAWKRALSDSELRSLTDNPWQIFKPQTQMRLKPLVALLRRALLVSGGNLRQITDVEQGIGLKPLVLINGLIQQRAAAEGLPIILDKGQLRTLGMNETLLL